MSVARTQWILELMDRVSGPMASIVSKTSNASSSIEALQANYKKLEKRSGKLQSKLKRYGAGALAFTALALGSTKFEQAQAKANTMAGLGADKFAKLNDQTKKIAANLNITRTALSEGLYQTISNGVPEKNWISFLQASTKASIGGVAELGQVVGVTSTVIKNYGLAWDQAGSVQDKIQMAAKLGKTSFGELGQYLPELAGSAKELHININELLGSYSALTGVSGNTAKATTQLSAIMNAMIKVTPEAADMAKKVGVAFNSQAIGEAGGLMQYLDLLRSKVEQKSTEWGANPVDIYGKMFGSSEALKGLLPLMSSVSDDFKMKTAEIANSAGTMDAAFAMMNNTTSAKLQKIRNNFGNTMDEVVTILEPVGQVVFGVTTKVIEFTGRFIKAHPVLSRFIIIGGAVGTMLVATGLIVSLITVKMAMLRTQVLLAAASKNVFSSSIARATLGMFRFLGTLAIGIIRVAAYTVGIGIGAVLLGGYYVGSLIAATAAQLGLNVAMSANPIGLVILGLTAVVGVVVLVVKHWDWLKSTIVQFGVDLLKSSPFGFLIPVFKVILPKVKEAFGQFFGWVSEKFRHFFGWIGKIGGAVAKFFGFGGSELNMNVKGIPGLPGYTAPAAADYNTMPWEKYMNPDEKKKEPSYINSGGGSVDNSLFTGNGDGAGGSGGSGKIITINMDIENNFNVGGSDMMDKVDQFAEEIMRRVNSRLRDGVIQFG